MREQSTSVEKRLVASNWTFVCSETTLHRFITANNCDVSAAREQLLWHLRWKEEYRVGDVLQEDFTDMFARNEMYWMGTDKAGHPVG